MDFVCEHLDSCSVSLDFIFILTVEVFTAIRGGERVNILVILFLSETDDG